MIEFIERAKYGRNFCGIYMIENIINHKVYIGKTKQPFYKRYQLHDWKLRQGTHDNLHLQRAYNKYGERCFKFSVVECSDNWTDDVYNQKEKYYISKYRRDNLSYNILSGGDGGIGRIMSEDTKKIIGEKNKIHMTGRTHSETTKKKMSESRKGQKYTRYKCTTIINENIAKLIKIKLMNGEKASTISKEMCISYKIVNGIMSNNTWDFVIVDGWETWYKNRKKSQRLTKQEVQELCDLYVNNKKSIEYLSAKYNRPINVIHRLLMRHNLIFN